MLKPTLWPVLLAALSSGALAATHTTNHHYPAAQVQALKVNVDFHDVDIQVASVPEVTVTVNTTVTGFVTNAARLEPHVTLSGGTVLIRPDNALRLNIQLGSFSGRVVVRVPAGRSLDVQTDSGHCTVRGAATRARVRCTTDSGHIEVTAPADAVTATSDSGSMELTGGAPTITARTDSGGITVQRGGSVTARSDSGRITLHALSGPLSANSDSGSIRADWLRAPARGRVQVSTESGDVALTFPAGTVLGGALRTDSGHLSVTQADGRRVDGRGTPLSLGDAPLQVRASTDSGSIDVRADR